METTEQNASRSCMQCGDPISWKYREAEYCGGPECLNGDIAGDDRT